jgi:hypothetical protein
MFNLTDGLLGQGVRCALLVTMNEPLGRLHPAVRRPGCCWAQVGFTPFAPAETTAWLAHHGCEETVHAPATLAELYARLEGPHRRARSSRARASPAGSLQTERTRGVDTPRAGDPQAQAGGLRDPVPR